MLLIKQTENNNTKLHYSTGNRGVRGTKKFITKQPIRFHRKKPTMCLSSGKMNMLVFEKKGAKHERKGVGGIL
ncbi:MAG TPA: hypothetical protein VJJ82_03420 [Candidatus Nanoarchaeia archaeon]|nr:hypothetical protein [Candidatus Nanoarchaeia archaeon]